MCKAQGESGGMVCGFCPELHRAGPLGRGLVLPSNLTLAEASPVSRGASGAYLYPKEFLLGIPWDPFIHCSSVLGMVPGAQQPLHKSLSGVQGKMKTWD